MKTMYRVGSRQEAWNVDGSSSDRLYGLSWIRHWEEETGLCRAKCSYADCRRSAQVGGHIWLRGKGVVIAPICAGCNSPDNADRMQGARSRLRSGVMVVESEYTKDMGRAERRIAESESEESESEQRSCNNCGCDISDRPATHSLCHRCWSGMQRRKCDDCGCDISDRPDSHSLCFGCWREERSYDEEPDYNEDYESSSESDY